MPVEERGRSRNVEGFYTLRNWLGGCLTANDNRFEIKSIFVRTSLLDCSDPRMVIAALRFLSVQYDNSS